MKLSIKQGKRKIGAIIQARVTSTSLPGKVLMSIEGKSMLRHIVERLRYAKKIDDIILAIPDSSKNDILEAFAKENTLPYIRGDEDDVLSRYYKAAMYFDCDAIVRITSDCAVIDPRIVDYVIEKHLAKNADYTSNTLERTYPRGLDVEIFSFDALKKAYNEAKEPHQREHVTPYIYEHPRIFALQNIEAKGIIRRPELRLTVDTEEDLALIKNIYHFLYKPGNIFLADEIITIVDAHPELKEINARIKQKELK